MNQFLRKINYIFIVSSVNG